MKVLNWNIRGMNSCRKRKALNDIITSHQIDIIAIQETKKSDFSSRILSSISSKLDIWHFLPSQGSSGGILFGGDSNKVRIVSISLHTFCMDVHVENKLDSVIWQLTIVYGPVKRKLKSLFWAELDLVRQGQSLPWILCGDFNALRSIKDKSGSHLDISISRSFNSFINRHNLVEHQLPNRKFTWSNGHQFALLDRFFTSLDWDQLYPSSIITDLGKNGSDHCPIILQVSQTPNFSPHQFRFDPLWLEQADFVQLLPQWWGEHQLSLPDIANSWHKKLGHVRRKIKGWAKNHYGQKKGKNNIFFFDYMS